MQAIWVVWEYDNEYGPEVYVYDVFDTEKEARKCATLMNQNQNARHYEVEKFYVHSKFVPEKDD